MSIAKIIVPVTGARRDAVALATAFAAAKPFNAHVVALFVHPDPRLSVPYMGTPVSPTVVQQIVDSVVAVNRAASKAARTAFTEAATAAQAAIVTKPKKTNAVSGSYRENEGYFQDIVARTARLSDLVVFGPIAPVDGPDMSGAFVETLLKTDRPVLLSKTVPSTLIGRIAVAWDGSTAAAHAITAALPFLSHAECVTILCMTHESGFEDEDAKARALLFQQANFRELEEYLMLQGIACSKQVVDRGDASGGEALHGAALKDRASLLVMGGYGHSHLREMIFGGVSDFFRWHADLPVLMVH